MSSGLVELLGVLGIAPPLPAAMWLIPPFVIAAAASLTMTPWVIRAAAARGIYDHPGEQRRVHTHPVPRLGGVAVFIAMLLGLSSAALVHGSASAQPLTDSKLYIGILVGGAIVFGAGLVDDLRELRPRTKLIAQVTAAIAIYAFGFRVEVLSWGPTSVLELGGFSLPLTVFWVVGITNAFNLIDGLDGLATGVALVALSTVLAVALVLGRLDVALVSIALLGALVGFLRYNFNPARIFLGDSGSLFVGFMLAVLSVHGATKSATAVLAIIPLFALALPLFDTALAMLRRVLRGVPMSRADKRHIHHQLLVIGLTTRRAVLLLYLVAALLAVAGVLVAFAPPAVVTRIAVAGGVVVLALLLYSMRRLDYHEFEEVGAVLMTGPNKLRKILSDRIYARDVAQVIRTASSLEEVNAILADSTNLFQFSHMEVCPLSAQVSPDLVRQWNGSPWKVDYPVSFCSPVDCDWYVLRVWCNLGGAFRPYGAERVAATLGPVVESWLVDHEGTQSPGTESAEMDERAEVELSHG